MMKTGKTTFLLNTTQFFFLQDEWWYDLKHVRHRFKGYGVIQQLAEKHAKAHQFSAFASIAFSVALQVRHSYCYDELYSCVI